MKILYLDFFLGMEIKMLLGALFSLGADKAEIEKQLNSVFNNAEILCEDVKRCGVESLKADILFESDKSFEYEKALEYIENIHNDAAIIYLKRIFKVYFEADKGALIKEKEICELYALHLALKTIDADYVISSSLKEGSGFYEKDGGYFIIPSHAALEIFKMHKIPVQTVQLETELTNVLAACVLSQTANEFGTMPKINIEKIGYGAGEKDLKMPNLLRIVEGTVDGGELEKMFASEDLFAEISEELFV